MKAIQLFVIILSVITLSNTLFAQPIDFDAVSFNDIQNAHLSPAKIEGSDNTRNHFPAGTVIVYETNTGRFGKMLILGNSYDLVFAWKTFNPNGSIHSQGTHLFVRGTYLCDLDQGIGNSNCSAADFWWQQVNSEIRYLVPQNGARFAIYDPIFDAISPMDILSRPLSPMKINGSVFNNHLDTGTILVYRTKCGRPGKLRIANYGYNLHLKWKTHNFDGSVFSEGGRLEIRGTWLGNLDTGREQSAGADFWWEQVNTVERYLVPQNGATFAIYDHLFNIFLHPEPAALLYPGERVHLTYEYNAGEPGGVRIFARPYTNGSPTPAYAAHPSPLYPAGKGFGDGWFTICKDKMLVNQIKFEIWDANQTRLLWEFIKPVRYYFSENCQSGSGNGMALNKETASGQPAESGAPLEFSLEQNQPNPFNPTTEIRFTLAQAVPVELKVFNLLGQLVQTLVSEELAAGSHNVRWNGCDWQGNPVAGGTYLYLLQAGDFKATKTMTLLK